MARKFIILGAINLFVSVLMLALWREDVAALVAGIGLGLMLAAIDVWNRRRRAKAWRQCKPTWAQPALDKARRLDQEHFDARVQNAHPKWQRLVAECKRRFS